MAPRTAKLTLTGLAALAALAVATTAAAQAPPQTPRIVDPDDPSRDLRQRQREIQRGVREADDDSLLRPDRRVTYEDVLRRPDDVDLNFAWAQTQVLDGDVKGAAATLERILLRNPNLPRVRLLRAVVLFRLESYDEAEREFAEVQDLPMDPKLRAEVARYQRQLTVARAPTRYAATVSIGMQYDWNRTATPASGQNLFLGVPLPVGQQDGRQSDWALVAMGRIEMAHDLGLQDAHRLTASATYLRNEQARVDLYDMQVGAVDAGAVLDFAPVLVQPRVYARNIRLANQRYGQAQGADVRVEQRLSGTLSVYGYGAGEYQNFDAISQSPTAPQNDGPFFLASAGVATIPHPEHRLGFEIGFVRKYAAEDFDSYLGPTATLFHVWLLGEGAFLSTSLIGEIDYYDAPDTFISDQNRRDTIGRFRSTLGVPIERLIGDELPPGFDALKDLTAYLFGEIISNQSTVENFEYYNWRWGFGLTKRWEF